MILRGLLCFQWTTLHNNVSYRHYIHCTRTYTVWTKKNMWGFVWPINLPASKEWQKIGSKVVRKIHKRCPNKCHCSNKKNSSIWPLKETRFCCLLAYFSRSSDISSPQNHIKDSKDEIFAYFVDHLVLKMINNLAIKQPY